MSKYLHHLTCDECGEVFTPLTPILLTEYAANVFIEDFYESHECVAGSLTVYEVELVARQLAERFAFGYELSNFLAGRENL